MSQELVKLNRKLFGTAVAAFAETWINLNGSNGYGEATYEAFTKGGLDIGSSHAALREWIAQTPGWKRRYDAASRAHEERLAGRDPNDPTVRKLERQLQHALSEGAGLREKLSAYDATQTVFEHLAETLDQIVEPLELVALKLDKAATQQHPVDMCVALTDQHADEVIQGPTTWGLERYNFDVFCLRLERWAKMVIEYATVHLPKHKVERVHVFHTGDAVHGDGHGNKRRNHFGNTLKAAVAVADAQAEAIAAILAHVPYVSVVCVPGNHPRTETKKDHVDPHDNFDFMVAALMSARLSKYIADGRCDVHAPKSWSAFVQVRGKVHALNHGDDVTGTWGIPWYGFAKKQARTQGMVARKDVKIDFFWFGHFHTDVAVTEGGARGVHSGAFTMTDAWTAEKIASGGEPMQAMMIVDDSPGMKCRLLDVPIWLRDEKAEDQYWAGTRAPVFGRTNTLTQLGASDAMALAGAFPLITARR